jgi:hypothetical protein
LKISDKDRTCLYSITVFIISVLLFTIAQSCKKLDFERVARLKTGEVTDITANSAYITGIIQDWGEGKITTYGHCWSVEENPTKFLKTKTEYDHVHLGEFYSSLDSLLPATTYFVRAYAVYEGETIYGERLDFTTASITGWQKSLGGSGDDDARSIQQTTDGGYIIAGYSNSDDGDVLENHGDYDCWIVKISED